MSAFPSPAADPADKTWGNAILTSYIEHRQVLGQSVSGIPTSFGTSGPPPYYDDPFNRTLWLEMQTWLETNCVYFVDHVTGPLDGSDYFLYFTLSSWRSAAGLNSAGFKRVYGPASTVGYGNIQIGDWRVVDNIIEIQKGFAALKWTSLPFGPATGLTDVDSSVHQAKYVPVEASLFPPDVDDSAQRAGHCALVRAAMDAAWTAAAWSSSKIWSWYSLDAYAAGSLDWAGGNRNELGHDYRASRDVGKYKLSQVKPIKADVDIYAGVTGLVGSPTWRDLDGTGLLQHRWSYIESFLDTQTTDIIGTNTYGNSSYPMTLAGISCPIIDVESLVDVYAAHPNCEGWHVALAKALNKWKFTYDSV